MKLARFDPLREMDELSSRLNTWLGHPARRMSDEDGTSFSEWAPALDVAETDDEYLITCDLPAIRKEDLRINLEDGMLTLEGERRMEKEEKKKFHRVERTYGRFMRRLALPGDVDQKKVAADFKDGVLRVHLPKSAESRPRAINVEVHG